MQDDNFFYSHIFGCMWMLIHVYIQAISDVFSDLKLATNTHVTHMHTYVQVIPAIISDFYDVFCSLFFTQPSPIQLCFYPSTTHFTCPNNRSRIFWTRNTLVMSKVTNFGYVMTPGDHVVFSDCHCVTEFIF